VVCNVEGGIRDGGSSAVRGGSTGCTGRGAAAGAAGGRCAAGGRTGSSGGAGARTSIGSTVRGGGRGTSNTTGTTGAGVAFACRRAQPETDKHRSTTTENTQTNGGYRTSWVLMISARIRVLRGRAFLN